MNDELQFKIKINTNVPSHVFVTVENLVMDIKELPDFIKKLAKDYY